MEESAPPQKNEGECLNPFKMCYQALKKKTNSPLKVFEWVKMVFVYSGGGIYSGGETRH